MFLRLTDMMLVAVYSVKHDITDVQPLMPSLILAIREVVNLKVTNLTLFQLFFSHSVSVRQKKNQLPLILAESGVWFVEFL